MALASRAVQEPAALAISVTGPGSGWAFTDRTYAKQRRVCAPRASGAGCGRWLEHQSAAAGSDLLFSSHHQPTSERSATQLLPFA